MVKTKSTIGSWAFLAGVILAIIFGLVPSMSSYMWIVVIIGLVVGLLNVSNSETTPFLMSGVVLIIAGSFGAQVLADVPYLPEILTALSAIFVPATIIVAIKNVYNLAKN